jgi:hypothetical protein
MSLARGGNALHERQQWYACPPSPVKEQAAPIQASEMVSPVLAGHDNVLSCQCDSTGLLLARGELES